MHKKFEINQKKIKGSCQSGRLVVTHDSKSDLPLVKKILNIMAKRMMKEFQHYRWEFVYPSLLFPTVSVYLLSKDGTRVLD